MWKFCLSKQACIFFFVMKALLYEMQCGLKAILLPWKHNYMQEDCVCAFPWASGSSFGSRIVAQRHKLAIRHFKSSPNEAYIGKIMQTMYLVGSVMFRLSIPQYLNHIQFYRLYLNYSRVNSLDE